MAGLSPTPRHAISEPMSSLLAKAIAPPIQCAGKSFLPPGIPPAPWSGPGSQGDSRRQHRPGYCLNLLIWPCMESFKTLKLRKAQSFLQRPLFDGQISPPFFFFLSFIPNAEIIRVFHGTHFKIIRKRMRGISSKVSCKA